MDENQYATVPKARTGTRLTVMIAAAASVTGIHNGTWGHQYRT